MPGTRMVKGMPLRSETTGDSVMSANARALRHVIEYRGAPDAEPEIRRVAICLLEIMQREAPHLFGDYQIEHLYDGSAAVVTEHKKV